MIIYIISIPSWENLCQRYPSVITVATSQLRREHRHHFLNSVITIGASHHHTITTTTSPSAPARGGTAGGVSPLHWAGVNGSVSHTMSSRGKSSENNIAINPATDGLQFLISIHGFVHSRYISEPRRRSGRRLLRPLALATPFALWSVCRCSLYGFPFCTQCSSLPGRVGLFLARKTQESVSVRGAPAS